MLILMANLHAKIISTFQVAKKEKRVQSKRPSIKHIDIDVKKKHNEMNSKRKNLTFYVYNNNKVILNGAL